MASAVARDVLGGGGRPLQTPLDRLGQVLGDHFGLFGGRWTNCSACAAGAMVVGEAFGRLRAGQAEAALVGAADSMLNPLGVGGFSLLRVLSTENDRPEAACRPFDATRQGTVLGEGAAMLVLETLERAGDRGAAPYAEVLGYGASMDAFRVSDPEPSGRGAVLAMKKALADARLAPEDIDLVSAHGTGTPKNDVVETAALKEALGPRARQVPVHAVKSMTGHLIAASGAVEAAAAALALARETVPPTINLRVPDPECDLDYVAEGARSVAAETVLSNSFGFGGQNASLVLGRGPQ
jgi:3-oxoacyl-[acyl-carrier-protein] synthase II